MKKVFFLLILILILITGCVDEATLQELEKSQTKLKEMSRINTKIDDCILACGGEETEKIPALKVEFQSSCYQVYYYGGEEELDKLIEGCKKQ
ncbi:MAG: hypothetical protein KKG75_01450 [Nanoarchaeota archaeon]|nr:hypothetical protein [Nanoarchaeota archaeon]